MLISIQQPEFFPWLGYFDKIRQVDRVVFLDNVQFKKRYFENRNKVRIAAGWTWLRAPVLVKGRYIQAINEVETDNSQPWPRKLTATLRHSYARAPFWRKGGGEELCELVEDTNWERLVDFNLAVIRFLMRQFALDRSVVLASEIGTTSSGSELILEICRKAKASAYLSGRDGRNYLDESSFAQAGIALQYQDFRHPTYYQHHGGSFELAMSSVDLLFNHGPDALHILTAAQGGPGGAP